MFGEELLVQDFSIKPGETKEFSIELNNPEIPFIMLEFEMLLPEGVSIAKDEDDEFLVELNSARIAKSHTLEVSDHGGGKYKFLAYSTKNVAFKGTSGEIINLTLTAAASVSPGSFQGKIFGQVFSKQDETGYYPEDKIFNVNIEGDEENITVTAKNYTRKYGEANPTFEFTTEGGTLEGVPEITCEATDASPVGTYPISINKGTVTNGKVTFVAGTLTIEKAPLTIKGGTYTMKQGDALPELKAEYEGFKNGEDESVLTKKPALMTTATSASEPGEYEVTVSGAEAQNYEITYQAGTITVNQADMVELDENSTTIPSPAVEVDVHVKRTIKANEWSTICLPFAMTEAQVKAAFGDDVELREFSSWSSTEDEEAHITAISVVFTNITAIEANHPCLIKTTQPIESFTADGVTVAPEVDPIVEVGKSIVDKGSLIGTYVSGTVVPKNNLFLYDNKFYYSKGQTKTKAFRAYFEFSDVLTEVENASAKISINFIEGTGIKGVYETPSINKVYTVNGIEVNDNGNLPKGIYIINGKKIVK